MNVLPPGSFYSSLFVGIFWLPGPFSCKTHFATARTNTSCYHWGHGLYNQHCLLLRNLSAHFRRDIYACPRIAVLMMIGFLWRKNSSFVFIEVRLMGERCRSSGSNHVGSVKSVVLVLIAERKKIMLRCCFSLLLECCFYYPVRCYFLVQRCLDGS